MAFLRLSDIGKIYSSENNVAVGIRKVNLSFDKGEFVAVTGKSGSGKTTLLNVIGGLDSYEEGEMYIEGKPTSHYIKADWDEYVAKYVSFIFQDYNILESFTVFENIEFALTSVKDLKERKRRALEIAERVGLKDRLNTKGVKLSGGEKQRTVIARAIAKDSPVILADEPTGNLDSVNAKSILALLKEVSKEKLVIVVTHNYEDVKEYATRHIRVYDGGIESDEIFERVKSSEDVEEREGLYEKERQYVFKTRRKKSKRSKEDRRTDARDKFILGWKRFCTRPRQNILISIVLFIALSGIILSISLVSNLGFYPVTFAVNDMEGRVLVATRDDYYTEQSGHDDVKQRNGVATRDDYYTEQSAQELADKYGASSFIMHDIYFDASALVVMEGDTVKNSEYFRLDRLDGKKADKGRLPQRADEVLLRIPYNYAKEYSVGQKLEMFNVNYASRVDDTNNQGMVYVISGIDYYVDNRKPVTACFTTEGYEYYSQFQRLNLPPLSGAIVEVDAEGFPVIEDEEGNFLDSRYMKDAVFQINFDLQGKVVETNALIDNNEGLYIRKAVSAAVLFTDVKYNEDLKPFISSLYDASCIVFSVSPEVFKDYFTEESKQISLIFENNKKASVAVDKMTRDGYSSIRARDINIMSNLSFIEKLINFFSTTLISLAFSVAVSLVVVVTLIKLMSLGRKDVSVFRTMGIADSTVKASTFVQLFLALVPALILCVILVLIMYFAPIGAVLQYMGWEAVFMIVLGMTIILLILAGSYNKLIYKQKIRKGLRRANK